MKRPRPAGRWAGKFAAATNGLRWSVRTQNSFQVYLPVTCAVILAAAVLQVEPWRWVVLVVMISVVWSVELLNTAIEQLVRALHPEHDETVGQALDAAAAGVLVVAIGSVAVGLITLAPPLWQALAP